MFGDYVVISLEKYEEIRDLYQKLSETEEQRKNMSQAYEDEYRTRLALQKENEILKNELDKVNIFYDKDCADYQKQIDKLLKTKKLLY